jgi:hypothetical protein
MTVYLIRGLPMGSYLQLVAENVYLRELDRSLAGLTGGMYARYGDDIFVACQEPTLMDEAIRTVSSFCASRDLKLSRNKSRRYTLLAPHAQESNMPVRTDSARASSFRYLGKQIMWNGEILLPRDKIRTVMNFIEQRLRRSLKQTSRGTLEERVALLCRASQTIVQGIGQWSCEPVRSYLEEVREPAQLKALDRQLMELVVSLARGTSFVRGDFRRFSPKQLREYGLVSFVHWKRTRRAYEVGGLR